MKRTPLNDRQTWPDYVAVWRWHFYAGVFCMPFICWLALTGSIYAFRPDIETWLDRPYEALRLVGPRAAPSSEVRAAVAAVPGSIFSHYEPAATPTGAAQIVVLTRDGRLLRVYVHPGTLQAMKLLQDDHRPLDIVSRLHGQLLLGSRGSMLVELAASWAVVMILTGFYLWFPRGNMRLGGLLIPRIRLSGRLFWRDLHAVTALWVSLVALFLLLSGLPWSANWGNYLTWLRNHSKAMAGAPDWPIGGTASPGVSMPGMSAAEMAAGSPAVPTASNLGKRPELDLGALDNLPSVAARLQVPRPIWISPPAQGFRDWAIASHIQNRPLRVTYTVSPVTGQVTGKSDFSKQNVVDKVVAITTAAHEGQLFGRLNQALLLLTALSLLLVSASASVMWWRRRPTAVLGAPTPAARPHFSTLIVVAIVALSLLLPLFGLSLLMVLVLDKTLLQRLPSARRWLGLAPHGV